MKFWKKVNSLILKCQFCKNKQTKKDTEQNTQKKIIAQKLHKNCAKKTNKILRKLDEQD